MGCSMACTEDTPAKPGKLILKDKNPSQIERDPKFYYKVTFLARPRHIHMTSSVDNTDCYITKFKPECPIQDVEKKKLTLNSKLIKINDILVEGCDIDVIGNYLETEKLPMKVLLAHPEGLNPDEVPAREPENIPMNREKKE